jgi:hypothetical protein
MLPQVQGQDPYILAVRGETLKKAPPDHIISAKLVGDRITQARNLGQNP